MMWSLVRNGFLSSSLAICFSVPVRSASRSMRRFFVVVVMMPCSIAEMRLAILLSMSFSFCWSAMRVDLSANSSLAIWMTLSAMRSMFWSVST